MIHSRQDSSAGRGLPHRVVISTKDIMNITGRGDRSARHMLVRIRTSYKKGKGSFVTVEEFCRFTGLKEEAIKPFMIS